MLRSSPAPRHRRSPIFCAASDPVHRCVTDGHHLPPSRGRPGDSQGDQPATRPPHDTSTSLLPSNHDVAGCIGHDVQCLEDRDSCMDHGAEVSGESDRCDFLEWACRTPALSFIGSSTLRTRAWFLYLPHNRTTRADRNCQMINGRNSSTTPTASQGSAWAAAASSEAIEQTRETGTMNKEHGGQRNKAKANTTRGKSSPTSAVDAT